MDRNQENTINYAINGSRVSHHEFLQLTGAAILRVNEPTAEDQQFWHRYDIYSSTDDV